MRAIAFVGVKAFFGASLVLGFATLPTVHATPQEDSPSWSCVDDGNRICGPNNPEHKPAGCYDDGGVLEFRWPCKAWTPADGWMHGDGSVSFPDGHVTPPDPDGRADSDDGNT